MELVWLMPYADNERNKKRVKNLDARSWVLHSCDEKIILK